MTITERFVPTSTDAEVLIDGYLCFESQHTLEVGMSSTVQDGTVGQDKWRYRQATQSGADFSMQGYKRSSQALRDFQGRWNEAQQDGDFLFAMWAQEAELTIGNEIESAYVVPTGNPSSAGVGVLTSLNLSADVAGRVHFGTLKSPHMSDEANVISSTDNSDYRLLRIDAKGPSKLGSVNAISDAPKGAVVGFTVKELVGSDAQVPTLTFNLPANEWRGGGIPPADRMKKIYVSHTVDGVLTEKEVGPYGAHQLAENVVEDLVALRWADGFGMFYEWTEDDQGNNTAITFKGNQGGATKDIVFPAKNDVPATAPWRGTDSGTLGSTMIRLFSQTGSGGSAVRKYLSPLVPIDEHHLDKPVSWAGIEDQEITKLGIEVRNPLLTGPSVYDFQVRYAIWYAPLEVL